MNQLKPTGIVSDDEIQHADTQQIEKIDQADAEHQADEFAL